MFHVKHLHKKENGVNTMNFQLFETMGLSGLDFSFIIIAMLIIMVLSLAFSTIALVKYVKLSKKYKKFMGGNEAKALESHIMELVTINKANSDKIEANKEEIKNLYKLQRYNFQKIGMIKYDAFKEMGGNLSFALTLLDANNNGFIINSVHNIQSSYCYAKEVKEGKCVINLSEEESIALERALKNE